MPLPTPLTRELPTHHRNGRIKFAVVLSMARQHRGLAREQAASGRPSLALPPTASARANWFTITLRTRIERDAAFHAVTNVPVAEYRAVIRGSGSSAWTDAELVRRYSDAEIAEARSAALAAALIRDGAATVVRLASAA